ncbi:putative receptor-like protein kinase At3g47110 [Juglans regia]|uniref:non-specific serine/threonine protein kinase n=1 Tax=Juglans regia TaxID=51240 RepID=A0A6P9EK58_JUGRE|nr:putative receptor-like protein kinase At3g47110 [Juglans regia]
MEGTKAASWTVVYGGGGGDRTLVRERDQLISERETSCRKRERDGKRLRGEWECSAEAYQEESDKPGWSAAPGKAPCAAAMPRRRLVAYGGRLVAYGGSTYAMAGNETDRLSLLEFKAKISHDPFMVFSSWNETTYFCLWYGVTCGHQHQRVIELRLPSLKLAGSISPFIGNLSFLRILLLPNNSFDHEIPPQIGRLHRLKILFLQYNSMNQVSGNIPAAIGRLHRLKILNLSGNNLSGSIPHSLGNLTLLLQLFLYRNYLGGSIPASLGDCKSLILLNLFGNNLNGSIPQQIFGLTSLSIRLTLSRNCLTGPLPMEVGNLKNLGELYISENMLFGEILSSLGSCIKLETLYMGRNFFQGTILPSFSSLRGLQALDLSQNNLSGKIPDLLANMKSLQILDISYDNFQGSVPTNGVFKNSSSALVVGNNQLCGGIPEMHLPKCNFKEPENTKLTLTLKLIICIVLGLLGVTSVLYFLYVSWLRKKRRVSISSSSGNLFLNISYQSLIKATDGLSSTNLLGVGSFGSVYEGVLDEGGTIIAVKVLNLLCHRAFRSFLVECEALRNIRHRNLVKVLTVCSSADYHGNDFKALVYEFMVNGSLEEWLHPTAIEDERHQDQRNLDLFQRLDIAIDVASALEYLHYHCKTQIIHCDIKPSNILLDNEMIGHVGDFGIARFSPGNNHDASTAHSSTIGLRGTFGYAAPEYGMGNEVSSNGDMYSYGIILLEMFIGKRPTDDIFQGTLNLYSFVKTALPQGVVEIADPTLFQEREEETTRNNGHNNNITRRNKNQECLVLIFRIGVACSFEQPEE